MVDAPKARILIVDDESEVLSSIERLLHPSYETVGVTSAAEAIRKVDAEPFQVILSDQRMPEMTGNELLAEIAKKKPLITRVMLTAHTDLREILQAINRAHIFRYIAKPWDNDELRTVVVQAVEHHRLKKQNEDLIHALTERSHKLQQKENELRKTNENLEKEVGERTAQLTLANQKLQELALRDPLTNVLNRRAFFERFNEEVVRSRRYKNALTVVMIDVDHFKAFNDMEGHVCGDEALKKLANHFLSDLRKTDAVGRYGGEEFILLFPETRLKNGVDTCERIRRSIEHTVFTGKSKDAYLTVSIGVASYPKDGETVEELVKSADVALYQAKQSGRNKVTSYQGGQASFFVRRES